VVFFGVAEIVVAVRLALQIIDVQTRKNEKKLAQINFLVRSLADLSVRPLCLFHSLKPHSCFVSDEVSTRA